MLCRYSFIHSLGWVWLGWVELVGWLRVGTLVGSLVRSLARSSVRLFVGSSVRRFFGSLVRSFVQFIYEKQSGELLVLTIGILQQTQTH